MNKKSEQLLEIDRLEREISTRRIILSKAGAVLTPQELQARTDITRLLQRLRKLKRQPLLF